MFKQMRAGAVIVDEETGKKSPRQNSVAAWANQEGVNVMAAEGSAQQTAAGVQPALLLWKSRPATR
jgi:hypothetical protein